MCGIHVVISPAAQISPRYKPSEHLHRCLCDRGPDHLGHSAAASSDDRVNLEFTSTVLSLRGDHVSKQPFIDSKTGSILCWNGEAWRFSGENVMGNDGEALFARLTAPGSDVLGVLRAIEGPFAFVFFDKQARSVYYGRDRLGRRSLLICRDESNSTVTLSSIAEASLPSWQEVPADGIYEMDLVLAQREDGSSSQVIHHKWTDDEDIVSGIGRFNMSIPSSIERLTAQSHSVEQLRVLLTESLQQRVLNVPRLSAKAANVRDVRVAVLFSGGLDCSVLARMIHDILPVGQGVDLINVAFENPRVAAQLAKQADGAMPDVYEACPDRITGRKSFAELLRVCPGRAWHFIAVNVPYTKMLASKASVTSLMYPHNTEMDLSIAIALYFAARGQGLAYTSANSPPLEYSVTARVLLSGLGADELFGGYSRHPAAFSARGYTGLVEELKLDVSRLGQRNLGRDDRVMACWGREVRFPYLNERLVRWAIQCPVWEKCDFDNAGDENSLEPGKRILRLLAAELGMSEISKEKKRAIQFGSRTAKMESGKVKGTTLIS